MGSETVIWAHSRQLPITVTNNTTSRPLHARAQGGDDGGRLPFIRSAIGHVIYIMTIGREWWRWWWLGWR
jgi:hypothetical protein